MKADIRRVIEYRGEEGKWYPVNFWSNKHPYFGIPDEPYPDDPEMPPVEKFVDLYKHNYTVVEDSHLCEILENDAMFAGRGLAPDSVVKENIEAYGEHGNWTYATLNDLYNLSKIYLEKAKNAALKEFMKKSDDDDDEFSASGTNVNEAFAKFALINCEIGFISNLAEFAEGQYNEDNIRVNYGIFW